MFVDPTSEAESTSWANTNSAGPMVEKPSLRSSPSMAPVPPHRVAGNAVAGTWTCQPVGVAGLLTK